MHALERGMPESFKACVQHQRTCIGLPCVVAVNRFPTDTDAEIDFIIEKCRELGVNAVLSTVWADGGAAARRLRARLCVCARRRRAISHSPIDADMHH